MDIKGKKINFLGDSITAGHGTSGIEATFWSLLQKNDGCISRGYGIGGTRIAKQLNASPEPVWDKYFGSRVAEMDADADVIVVFGGTNDYGHGDAPLGRFEDRNDTSFYGAMHNLTQALINKYPSAQLVYMTPLHRIGENRPINERGIRCTGRLVDYVNAITEVAAYYAVPVLDLYRLSGMQPEVEILKEKYMPDGLHPNDAGHVLIYNKLKGFIKAL